MTDSPFPLQNSDEALSSLPSSTILFQGCKSCLSGKHFLANMTIAGPNLTHVRLKIHCTSSFHPFSVTTHKSSLICFAVAQASQAQTVRMKAKGSVTAGPMVRAKVTNALSLFRSCQPWNSTCSLSTTLEGEPHLLHSSVQLNDCVVHDPITITPTTSSSSSFAFVTSITALTRRIS